ncbi:MAG: flippase-like domain-containing protein [Bacteroidales bacterium]|nr:flippase-like domain-containing protein [Bacteroidales bacterium]
MKKNVIKYVLSFVLAAVLVYFAFRTVNWAEFWNGLKETRWGYIVLFLIFSVFAIVFREERWRSIIKPIDPEVKRVQVWDSINVGNLVNVVLPGAGEFVRCGYVSGKNMSYDKALGTIVCERVCDFVAVFLMFAGALAAGWGKWGSFLVEQIWAPAAGRMSFSLWWIIGGVLLVLAAFFWAVFHWQHTNKFCGKVAGVLKGFGAGFAALGKMENKWLFLLQTVAIWVMYVLMSWAVLKALPAVAHLNMADALFISAVGNIASVVPVPGGIGAYHYMIALTLQALYGASWDMGILYATMCHEIHALLIIVLGIISYVGITTRKKQA